MIFSINHINKFRVWKAIAILIGSLLIISCDNNNQASNFSSENTHQTEEENIPSTTKEDNTSTPDPILKNTEAEEYGDCPEIFPFCSDLSYNFSNNVNKGTAPEGPNYGCNPANELPNPIWYYLEVAQPGKIDIKISQSTQKQGKGKGIDVDYVMWGPFEDVLEGCSQIMAGKAAPIQSSWSPDAVEYISIGGTGGSTVNAVLYGDCSQEEAKKYSRTTLPPAKKGEIYIIVISNWDNRKGYYVFEQTNRGKSGAGATECKIVKECNINGLKASLKQVEAGVYTISGHISVLNPPEDGDLMIKSSDGTTQKIASAPFTKSRYDFTATGFPATGQKTKIEAYFSSAACTRSIEFQAPEDCHCDVPLFKD